MQDLKSTAKSVDRIVWGDWDEETIRLDMDKIRLDEVKYWAFRTLKWHKLEGFIILETSRKDYTFEVKGKISV